MATRGKIQRPARPAVIVSSDAAEWASCKIITPNLEKAYRSVMAEKAEFFSFTVAMTTGQVWRVAQRIYDFGPDRLVFLDHMPHPIALIKALEQLYGRKPLPAIYVHIYGDFTLYSRQWLQLEETLRETSVQFICASERQLRLVSRFLVDPVGAVGQCPFPLDRETYFVDEKLRKNWRARLGLEKDELAILYTGRISLQKNSIRLVSEVLDLAERTGRKVRLLLAGTFDDIGAPFFGVHLKKGFYFQRWKNYVDSLPSDQRECVQYLGQFGPEVLKGLYNAADFYFSLSMHHDEDYGMSPAEALCCGTPCVLTSWGGYASFVLNDPRNAVELIPIRFSSTGISFSSTAVQKALSLQAKADQSDEARLKRSEAYLDSLSIEAANRRIREFHEVLPPVFQGFNWLMKEHAEAFSKPVLFPAGPKRGTFYEEIYGAYIQD